MRTNRFIYTRDNKQCFYLLMPDEARDIMEKLESKDWENYPLSFWFERYTGYSMEGIDNLRLEVCWIDKPTIADTWDILLSRGVGDHRYQVPP